MMLSVSAIFSIVSIASLPCWAATSTTPFRKLHTLSQDVTAISNNYIVFYHPEASCDAIELQQSRFAGHFAAQDHHSAGTELPQWKRIDSGELRGFTAEMTAAELALMEGSNEVSEIWPDMQLNACPFILASSLPPTSRVVPDDGSPTNNREQDEAQENHGKDETDEGRMFVLLDSKVDSWGLGRISKREEGSDQYTHIERPNHPRREDIRVYVLDSGIRVTHNEFWDSKRQESRAEWGPNFIEGSDDADRQGHGTHIAGTIAGNTLGIDSSITVVSVKILGDNGSGSVSALFHGVNWSVADAQARNATCIINASVSLEDCYDHTSQLMAHARREGCLVVVAAGNDGQAATHFSPACSDDTLAVGAIEAGDRRADFSNWGTSVNIFAPGVSITSASNASDDGRNTLSGTSMASPHVAGLAAYFAWLFDLKAPDDIWDKIMSTATVGKLGNRGPCCPDRIAYNGICDVSTHDGAFCSFANEQLQIFSVQSTLDSVRDSTLESTIEDSSWIGNTENIVESKGTNRRGWKWSLL